MHKIPITQMEILRDTSSLFYKDLPLKPYYKALTSSIIFANNSLKLCESQNIEAFFKDYICEKSPKENKDEDSDDYDEEDGEYYENQESVIPSSGFSSQTSKHQIYNSTTSLQEIMEARFKEKAKAVDDASKQLTSKEIKKISPNEKKYYSFPKKYNNYKYEKLSLEDNNKDLSTIDRNRRMILKNQSKFGASLKKMKFLNEKGHCEDYNKTAQHKILMEKAFQTQQSTFLLPEEKKNVILKNLDELKHREKNHGSTSQKWISPYVKYSKGLPKISERIEISHECKNKFSIGKNIKRVIPFNDPSFRMISFSNDGFKAGKLKNENLFPNLNLIKNHKNILDYKLTFEEYEHLRKLSITDKKSLDNLLKKNKGKLSTQKGNSQEIQLNVFLNYYPKLFQKKPWIIIEHIFKAFNINTKEKFFDLDFNNFINFKRVLIHGCSSPEETLEFLINFFFGQENEVKSQRIYEIIEGLINSYELNTKTKKDLKEKLLENLIGNLNEGKGTIDRKELRIRMKNQMGVPKILMQILSVRIV